MKTWIQIIAQSHILLKKSKTTLKIYYIKTKSMVFYKYLQLLLFSKTSCLIFSPPCSPKLSPFELSQITSSWSKQQKFRIQTKKVPSLIHILIALFIQNHILILPPWHSTPSSCKISKIECWFGPIDVQLFRVSSLFAFSWAYQYYNLPQSFAYNL